MGFGKASRLIITPLVFLSSCLTTQGVLERKLSVNPVEASIGRYSYLFDDTEREIERIRELAEDEDVSWFLSVLKEMRGEKLTRGLNKKIEERKFSEEDLLFVFTGAIHLNEFYFSLKDRFNVFFFSEVPYLLDEEEFSEISPFLFSQFLGGVGEGRFVRGRPNAIIYGDYHTEDFDFSGYFPNVSELKDLGIKRVFLAYERMRSEFIDLNSFENYLKRRSEVEENKSLLEYLREAENSGVKVEIFGLE